MYTVYCFIILFSFFLSPYQCLPSILFDTQYLISCYLTPTHTLSLGWSQENIVIWIIFQFIQNKMDVRMEFDSWVGPTSFCCYFCRAQSQLLSSWTGLAFFTHMLHKCQFMLHKCRHMLHTQHHILGNPQHMLHDQKHFLHWILNTRKSINLILNISIEIWAHYFRKLPMNHSLLPSSSPNSGSAGLN